MATDLSKVNARDKLKPRREPYWQRLDVGKHLGFRKMTEDSPGSWCVRWPGTGGKKYEIRTLGNFENLLPGERHGAAVKAAREHLDHIGAGGSNEVHTVESACRLYVEHLQGRGEHENASDTEARFRRWVRGDSLAKVVLQTLNRRHIDAWRKKVSEAPVVVNPSACERGEEVVTRSRKASTLNRDMTALRAALNFAQESGHVISNLAWISALKSVKGADSRREVYLTAKQRHDLLSLAEIAIRPLLSALCNLPIRPGAAAALVVADFDKRSGTLTINKDKSHAGRKIKLEGRMLALTKEAIKDKLPGAALFDCPSGQHWDKDSWKKPFKRAIKAAGLPTEATLYCLRHSGITDMVEVGEPLLTIAQISGTSVAMIEKHYGHLQPKTAAKALQVLSF